jgi:hypothetical protein
MKHIYFITLIASVVFQSLWPVIVVFIWIVLSCGMLGFPFGYGMEEE